MKLPEPFEFDGPGVDGLVIHVEGMVSVLDDKSITRNIHEPSNSTWFSIKILGSSTRMAKNGNKFWPRIEIWQRRIVTDGTAFYNVISSTGYNTRTKKKRTKMISRHRTYANRLGTKERALMRRAIKAYLRENWG